MTTTPDTLIETVVRQLVKLLVAGRYDEVERLTGGVRLSAQAIGTAIKAYGGKLVFPTDEAFSGVDAIQIQGAVPEAWSVRFHLSTEDEGPSDLTMELTIKDERPEAAVEFDDLHVL